MMFEVTGARTGSAVATACVVLAGLAAVPAGAQSPPDPGTVTAVGQGSVVPTPRDRTSNASIAKAVADAQAEAMPKAVAAARARAQALATSAGLTLGRLSGISDGVASPYYGYGYGVEGTFGPGRYCGTVGRYRVTRLENGRTIRTRIGSRRTCRVPRYVVVAVTATFGAAPAA